MSYTAVAVMGLASQCAPNVAPRTVAAIVQTESRGEPLALNVNRARQPAAPSSVANAIATARRFVTAGYSVDLGLGQINSRNMHKLGLTWETVFDPCINIAALGYILSQNYQAVAAGRDPQSALRMAISLYNTGSPSRGFRNGYVATVVRYAGVSDSVAANYRETAHIDNRDVRTASVDEDTAPLRPGLGRDITSPPAWNLFERAAYDREAASQSGTERGTSIWTE